MMSRSLRFVAGLLGAALLSAPALAADPILIGVSLTQSPPGSVVQGTQVKDGMEILKDIVNAKGGVLGRPSSASTNSRPKIGRSPSTRK